MPKLAPRVSILIAARDAAATLGEALASVAAQDFHDWECVVVDDGSRDGSRALLEQAATEDARFRHLSHEAPRGVVAARNLALAHCRGEFIALLDADDRMAPQRLSRQLEMLAAAPQLAGVGCHVRYFPRAALGPGRRAYEEWLNHFTESTQIALSRFVEMPLGHPTLMLRRKLLQAFGWRDGGWPEDWDLLLRLMADGHRLGIVPEVLHHWRLHRGSLSRHSPAFSIAAFTRCRAAHLAAGALAKFSHYALAGYGRTGKALRRELAQHGKHCHTIYETHPARIGQCMDGAEVLAWEAQLTAPTTVPLLVSVAGASGRTTVRTALSSQGWCEGEHFWLVA